MTVNDRPVSVEKGTYLLEVCRGMGLEIPTMCQNEAITRGGHCRLCLVELREGSWSKVVTSCLYPAKEGLAVYTDTPQVKATRDTVLQLMLARAPKARQVRELAEKFMGSADTPYASEDPGELCILCGQCVATCSEVVGVSAIGVTSRGVFKKVGTPFERPSEPCIGCGACAFVCPTEAIPMKDQGGVRTIWGRDFALLNCISCGAPYIPADQVTYLVNTYGIKRDFFDKCPNCR
jgi:NADH dehydrogenase/NADH:ubiquinone oxidoreductase subunit G